MAVPCRSVLSFSCSHGAVSLWNINMTRNIISRDSRRRGNTKYYPLEPSETRSSVYGNIADALYRKYPLLGFRGHKHDSAYCNELTNGKIKGWVRIRKWILKGICYQGRGGRAMVPKIMNPPGLADLACENRRWEKRNTKRAAFSSFESRSGVSLMNQSLSYSTAHTTCSTTFNLTSVMWLH